MTHEFIREQIDHWNSVIEENFDPSTFVLNEKVEEAYNEIDKLQAKCEHEYDENGFCKYCLKPEELE